MGKHRGSLKVLNLKDPDDGKPLSPEAIDDLVMCVWDELARQCKIYAFFKKKGFTNKEIGALISPKFNVPKPYRDFLPAIVLATSSQNRIDKCVPPPGGGSNAGSKKKSSGPIVLRLRKSS